MKVRGHTDLGAKSAVVLQESGLKICGQKHENTLNNEQKMGLQLEQVKTTHCVEGKSSSVRKCHVFYRISIQRGKRPIITAVCGIKTRQDYLHRSQILTDSL